MDWLVNSVDSIDQMRERECDKHRKSFPICLLFFSLRSRLLLESTQPEKPEAKVCCFSKVFLFSSLKKLVFFAARGIFCLNSSHSSPVIQLSEAMCTKGGRERLNGWWVCTWQSSTSPKVVAKERTNKRKKLGLKSVIKATSAKKKRKKQQNRVTEPSPTLVVVGVSTLVMESLEASRQM